MTPTNLIEETPGRSERAPRIVGTPAAVALISQLKQQHGPVMFHQSGGCCDGSAPLCFRQGEFRVSAQDVRLGDIDGTPFTWVLRNTNIWPTRRSRSTSYQGISTVSLSKLAAASALSRGSLEGGTVKCIPFRPCSGTRGIKYFQSHPTLPFIP